MKNTAHFFEMGKPEQRRWPTMSRWKYLTIIIFVATVIFVVAALLGFVVTWLSGGPTDGSMPSDVNGMVIGLVAGFLPIFVFVYLALRFFERRGLASVGMQRKNALRNYLRGVLVGLVLFGSVVLILWLLGYATIENPFNAVSVGGAFVILIGWIVQGAAEEVLTRGFVFQIFGRMTNSKVAIIISAIFFAILHGANPGIGIVPIINLLVVSIFFAMYVLYEGGLWGAFGAHTIWNWAQGNLFGFEVSGNVIESAIVFDLMETGPDLVTGGSFGPEGGLIVSLVIVVAIIAIYTVSSRSE